MGNHLDPGPPLTPSDEYCPCDPPTSGEYGRAIGAAVLATVGGGAAWFVVALATERLWGVAMVLIGVLTGMAINRAANGHKSLALGIIAGVAAVLGSGVGYALLYLPFVDPSAINRQLGWLHFGMLGLGIFIAYRLAGSPVKPEKPL